MSNKKKTKTVKSAIVAGIDVSLDVCDAKVEAEVYESMFGMGDWFVKNLTLETKVNILMRRFMREAAYSVTYTDGSSLVHGGTHYLDGDD